MTGNNTLLKLPFHIAPHALDSMREVAKIVNDDEVEQDAIIIFSGNEGVGKTRLSSQFAYATQQILKKEFNREVPYSLDNFSFNPDQFINIVQESKWPPGTPIIYDEAVTGALGLRSMNKKNQDVLMAMNTCRDKRYIIFFNIPRFKELARWLAVDRSLALYEPYFVKSKIRAKQPGQYVGFDYQHKEFYYNALRSFKFGSEKRVSRTMPSTFRNWFPFSPVEYKKRKHASLKTLTNNKEVPKGGRKLTDEQRLILKRLLAFKRPTMQQIASAFGVSQHEVYRTNAVVYGEKVLSDKNISEENNSFRDNSDMNKIAPDYYSEESRNKSTGSDNAPPRISKDVSIPSESDKE